MPPHKFKVGDTVTVRSGPFNLHEVIKQLPDRGDEHNYRLSSANKPRKRDVREGEITNLDDVLDDLLSAAGVKSNPTTRSKLLIALCEARNAIASEQAVPADLLNDLARSIAETTRFLAKSKRYNKMIGDLIHELGAGVVDVSPLPLKVPNKFKLFSLGTIEGTAIIRLQELLKAWHHNVKHWPRKKPERPKKENEAAIVCVAIGFFSRHSARKPSTDPKNPLSAFVQVFYECVTGTKPESSFEHQIRRVLLSPSRFRHSTEG